jgi:hypothetical protein
MCLPIRLVKSCYVPLSWSDSIRDAETRSAVNGTNLCLYYTHFARPVNTHTASSAIVHRSEAAQGACYADAENGPGARPCDR